MKTEANPYSAPTENEQDSPNGMGSVGRSPVEFGAVIKTWERLRIAYNVVLVAFTILLTAAFYPEHVSDLLFWFAIGIGGIIANLCFLIAPAIEGYGRQFGIWHKSMTWLLFLAGVMLTITLAWDCIANYRQLLGAN